MIQLCCKVISVHLCLLMPLHICMVKKKKKKVRAAALSGCTVGWGAQRPLGRKDSSHPPLFFFFCWVVLKGIRPHNRRLSAGLLGRESLIIIPGSRSELRPRESQQIDSLPADWDSHTLVRKWKKLLPGGEKSAGKFQWACVWKKQGASFLGAPLSRPLLPMKHLYVCTIWPPAPPWHCLVTALICGAPPMVTVCHVAVPSMRMRQVGCQAHWKWRLKQQVAALKIEAALRLHTFVHTSSQNSSYAAHLFLLIASARLLHPLSFCLAISHGLRFVPTCFQLHYRRKDTYKKICNIQSI